MSSSKEDNKDIVCRNQENLDRLCDQQTGQTGADPDFCRVKFSRDGAVRKFNFFKRHGKDHWESGESTSLRFEEDAEKPQWCFVPKD